MTNEEAVATTLENIASSADAAAKPFTGIVACAGVQQASMAAIDYPVEDFNSKATFVFATNAERYTDTALLQGF